MKARRVMAVALRHAYLLRGSPARFASLFVWVMVDIVLWGFITRYLDSVAGPKVNFAATLLGAVLLWDFLTRVMHGVTTAFFEDVWSRNFLNIFATPLSVSEYILGLVVTSVVTSLLGLVVMLAMATGLFGLSVFSYGAMLLPFLLVLFLFGIALGVVACAVVLRHGPSAEWFVWPVPAFLSPFACVFYPLTTLPEWMQGIALALPPSYVFEAMRAVSAGHAPEVGALVWSLGLCLAYVALAGWTFARTYRRAVRGGLIARYTAESVS